MKIGAPFTLLYGGESSYAPEKDNHTWTNQAARLRRNEVVGWSELVQLLNKQS